MRLGKLYAGKVEFRSGDVAGHKPFLQESYLFRAGLLLGAKQFQTPRGQKMIQQGPADTAVHLPSRIGQVEARSLLEVAGGTDAVSALALGLERYGKIKRQQIGAGNTRR